MNSTWSYVKCPSLQKGFIRWGIYYHLTSESYPHFCQSVCPNLEFWNTVASCTDPTSLRSRKNNFDLICILLLLWTLIFSINLMKVFSCILSHNCWINNKECKHCKCVNILSFLQKHFLKIIIFKIKCESLNILIIYYEVVYWLNKCNCQCNFLTIEINF